MRQLVSIMLFAGMLWGAQQSSVTQHGITWTFDKAYETGQFVNGDYWVLGPVTITAISPDALGGANGWEVNPSDHVKHAFDSTCPNYDAALMPSLPYTAKGGESIVKATRHPDPPNHVHLKTAAVLTVVSEVPEGNGASLFRPAYYGSEKVYYSADSLDLSVLPNLALVGGAKDMAWVTGKYQKVQLDHIQGPNGRTIHPEDNMPDYGSDIARNSGEAGLALCLDYPAADKKTALINYVQMGLDLYYMYKLNVNWSASGGHMSGRKLPICVAAVTLGDREIADAVKAAGKDPLPDYGHQFSEDGQIYYSANADNGSGKVLYGDYKWAEGASRTDTATWEYKYWQSVYADQGNRLVRDPYGYIDGGVTPGGSYQVCCVSMPNMATALASALIEGVTEIWDNPTLLEYSDRWKSHGAWTQPDPCAPPPEFTTGDWDARDANGYGVTWGPDPANPGDCIRDTDDSDGTGRFPGKHGASTFDGGYTSSFTKLMYAYYRNTVNDIDEVQVNSNSLESGIDVFPNPVRGNDKMVIKISSRTGRDLSLQGGIDIYNAAGEMVLETIHESPLRSFTWDGCDMTGRRVDNGTYFIRSGSAVQRIMVVK